MFGGVCRPTPTPKFVLDLTVIFFSYLTLSVPPARLSYFLQPESQVAYHLVPQNTEDFGWRSNGPEIFGIRKVLWYLFPLETGRPKNIPHYLFSYFSRF